MMGMTPKQAALLNFIKGYVADKGCSPSFDEMKDGIGTKAKSNVHRYLEGLERRGLVRRTHGFKRSIEVVDDKSRTSFFEDLNPDVKKAVSAIAEADGTTPDVLMRQWIRERAEYEWMAAA
jgi:SOS-response transcriptional repressor LexA